MIAALLAASAPLPPPTTAPTTTPTVTTTEFPTVLFTVLLLSTLVAAIVVMALPQRTAEQLGRMRITAVFGSAAALLLALGGLNVQIGTTGGGATHTYEEQRTWWDTFVVKGGYHLTSDGMTLTLLLVQTLLFLVAVVMAWRVQRRLKLYLVLLLAAETGANGVLLSNDWFLFWLFWGLLLFATWALVHTGGTPRHERAARRFALAHAIGYALLLVTGLVLMYKSNQSSSDFDIANTPAWCPAGTPGHCGDLLALGFWLAFVPFAAALGTILLHRWYVDVLAEAPAGVAVVAGGVLPLLGGYGILRLAVQPFPQAAERFSLAVIAIGVVTAAWGAVAAYGQGDLRRAIAYNAVSRNGVVVAAIGALHGPSLDGAVLALCANALGTSMLLVIAATVQERARTAHLSRLSGLADRMPRLSALWFAAVASVAGVPLLAGFSADLAVLTGTYQTHRIAALALAICITVASVAPLYAMHRVLFGAPREEDQRVRDAGTLELFGLLPLLAASALFGIMPGRVLPLIELGVTAITGRLPGGG